MTSPVKDANSDRKRMKAAEDDVKLTHRKTLTFTSVEQDSRICISGSKRVTEKLKRMSPEEFQDLKVGDLQKMMNTQYKENNTQYKYNGLKLLHIKISYFT